MLFVVDIVVVGGAIDLSIVVIDLTLATSGSVVE
jgi:hypothetical protein